MSPYLRIFLRYLAGALAAAGVVDAPVPSDLDPMWVALAAAVVSEAWYWVAKLRGGKT